MKKIVTFIVDKSKLILILFLILTACSLWLATKVDLNYDMTKYLPDDSPMKQGMDIMNDEFNDNSEETSTFRLMFKGIDDDEKEQIYTSLTEIEFAKSIDFQAGNTDYDKDGYTLYVITVAAASNSQEASNFLDTVYDMYSDYDIYTAGEIVDANTPVVSPEIIIIAGSVLLIILFMMSASWIEPLLFLATIGISILINMGTNVFLGSVSFITYSISSILQVCLSMDYSIILSNRYNQEKQLTRNNTEAMKNALMNSASSIISSSLTTIVGLLALVFMSFKIGEDMGFILAKGVFISLICIFTILPGLMLMFDTLIQKTQKKVIHIKLDAIGKLSYKLRYVIPVLFLLVLVGSTILKDNVDISMAFPTDDVIEDVFPSEKSTVLLYENLDEIHINDIVETLEENDAVMSISSYATTLGNTMNYSEIAELTGMDETTSKLLFYYYFNGDDIIADKSIPLGEFSRFLIEDVSTNELFSGYFTDDTMGQFNNLISATSGDSEMMSMEMTSSEFAAMAGMDENMASQLYVYYFALYDGETNGEISLYEFVSFIVDDLAEDEQFAIFLDSDALIELENNKTYMDDSVNQLVGKNHSRMIITTNLPEESDETTIFFDTLISKLNDSFNGDYYLIGDSAMSYEMSSSFTDELNSITLLAIIAIFTIVTLTFRNVLIPLILVCIIQCAVYITMGTIYIQGDSIFYIALLIVQCLLIGATIDYGILYTSYYRELRKTMDIQESLTTALKKSSHTILTSSLILILITAIVGLVMSEPMTALVCITISKGALCATLLVIFVLPSFLSAFDKFIVVKAHSNVIDEQNNLEPNANEK